MSQLQGKSLGTQCVICHNDYDLYYRTPRVVPKCGHTFCEKCISSRLIIKANRRVFQCPECPNDVIIRKSVADDVPKNISVIEIVKNIRKYSSNEREDEKRGVTTQSCYQHRKPLQLICQTCNMKKICSHCALFGEHKAHTFCKQMPATKLDMGQLKQVFQIVSDSIKQTLLPHAQNNIKKMMKMRVSEGLKKHITTCFKSYYDIIQRRQFQTLQQCENILINEGGIDRNIDKLISEYDWLRNKYQNQWKVAVQSDNEKYRKMISLEQIQQYIMKCKELHTSVEDIVKHAENNIDKIVRDIGLKVQQSIVFKIQEMPFSLKRIAESIDRQEPMQSPQKKLRMKSVNSQVKSKSVIDKQENKGTGFHIIDRNSNKSQNKVVTIAKKQRDNYSHVEKEDQNEQFSLLQSGRVDLGFYKQNQLKELKELVSNKNIPIDKRIERGSLPPKANRSKNSNHQSETCDFKTLAMKQQRDRDEDYKNSHITKDLSPAKTISVVSAKQTKSMIAGPSVSLTDQLKFVRPTKQISFHFLSKFQELMVSCDRQSSLSCLQLVGADINDTLLLYILDYLRIKKYRFQIIKLVKNCISDQGFRILLSSLINDNTTQVLNLTSNQLTARSLQLILMFAQKNNILRTIYITNNKISTFQLKTKRAQFQKYELQIII